MFHEQKILKLMPRRDDLFQTIERINDNACKVDLPGEYDVNATFNAFDLSLFEVGDDSRMNHSEKFQEEREWCNPSNTKIPIKGFSWSGDKT